MAMQRGIYGIEYSRQPPEEGSSVLVLVIALVAVVALISFTVTLVRRSRADDAAEPPPPVPVAEVAPPPAVVEPATPPPPPLETALSRRPPKVRNLLLRLEEAERRCDIEMAVSTIEQLRALPGQPAADLDDALARRLGTLNLKRLFELKCAQWVKTLEVKRGDNASRIASEHGTTVATLRRLNPEGIDKLSIGRKLFVLDHPRFNLVVHRRSRTADLSLNGKFFRRYDLTGEVTGEAGAYELTESRRKFWREHGIELTSNDRQEVDTLMPGGSPVLIAEL